MRFDISGLKFLYFGLASYVREFKFICASYDLNNVMKYIATERCEPKAAAYLAYNGL